MSDSLVSSQQPAPGTAVIEIHCAEVREPELSLQLKEALTNEVHRLEAARVILDLKNLEFIGSVGLLGFLSLRRLPSVERIVVCGLHEHVASVFVACRLIKAEGDRSAAFERAKDVAHATLMLESV